MYACKLKGLQFDLFSFSDGSLKDVLKNESWTSISFITGKFYKYLWNCMYACIPRLKK